MILDPICESTRREVARLRARTPIEAIRARARSAPPPRDFARALAGPPLRLIAEIKKASPSAGLLRPRLSPERIARAYRDAGAAAISVVTERRFFAGDPRWIPIVRKASNLPVLMKDFFLDPWQIVRARTLGADAILLIARILAPSDLKAMLALSRDLGMEPLVECHTASEVCAAAKAGARIVGVNCRDLDTLEVDLGRTLRMARLLPAKAVRVAESGVKTRADALALERADFDAILVGEALMRSKDPGAAIRALLGGKAERQDRAVRR